MSRPRSLLFAAIIGFGCWHDAEAQTHHENPKLGTHKVSGGSPENIEIQELIVSAGLAPPELAAEVLLRLIESGKISDPKLRLELLRRAFYYAPSAKYSMRLIAGVPQARRTDSDSGIIWAALNNNLDTLSIRCRVVHGVLDLNPKRARDLFSEVILTPTQHRSCEDALIESPDLFYTTLRELADRGFDVKERREGRNIDFVRRYVHKISSPAEIGPALRMMLELKNVTSEDLSVLLREFSLAIEYIDASGRSAFAVLTPAWFQDFAQTVNVVQGRGLPTTLLLSSLKKLFVKLLNGPQCAEAADNNKQGAQNVVDLFNKVAVINDLSPIELKDLKSSGLGAPAAVSKFWTTPESNKLLLGLKRLRFGTGEQEAANLSKPARSDGRAQFLTKDQRSTREWQTEVTEYLNQLDNWKSSNSETEENYFNQMCFIYDSLIELMPASSSLKIKVLANYLAFLKASLLKRDNPVMWYLHFLRLIPSHDSPPEEAMQVRGEIQKTADPLMDLFLGLDQVLKTPKT